LYHFRQRHFRGILPSRQPKDGKGEEVQEVKQERHLEKSDISRTTPLIGEMWAKERIPRYSAQYMLSGVGSCWSRGHAFSNQTVRMETDGTSEPALLQVDPGLTHSVQILFRSFEESASQIR
jgi:hypothetical protein